MTDLTQSKQVITRQKSFDGWVEKVTHPSKCCQCDMTFSIYLPKQAETQSLPVLYWLSGLTCTDDNFMQKAGAQRYAAQYGIILVAPDTSPRGKDVPDDTDSWDFGMGAGFYLTATETPWSKNYNMYDYITEELPQLIHRYYPVVQSRQSIFGHSMGGHGALTVAFKNPGKYCSVSAFAPISSPTQCPWGKKAFQGYLGEDRALWANYDASLLVPKTQEQLPLLIDQGNEDNFLTTQLKPELFNQACDQANYPLTYRLQAGYDHSYFFIASFIGEHIEHHHKALNINR